MLGTSDAWSMSRLSHQPSKPSYILKIVGFLSTCCLLCRTGLWGVWAEQHSSYFQFLPIQTRKKLNIPRVANVLLSNLYTVFFTIGKQGKLFDHNQQLDHANFRHISHKFVSNWIHLKFRLSSSEEKKCKKVVGLQRLNLSFFIQKEGT